MATAEKRVVTDATGQAMLAELRKIPGVMNPLPVEKGGTGVTTPEEIRELIGAQEKFDFNVEEQLNAAVKSVNNIKPDSDGNVRLLHVQTADNLSSDEAQAISGAFIERTTGGDASVNDGIANLTVLYGNSVRSGYSAESKSMDVQLVGRLDDSEPMSATIDWSAFKTAVSYISTNKTFTYTTAWNENPETYGITISGTPASGDVINVYFVAENRGTIVNATPETFVETNWNLYDHTLGYARVLKYSYEYGFKIGGTYTSVAFATTVEGAQTVVTPDSNGIFTIPEDGYVFVNGGNDTDTYILMTWSDWDDGYTGDFITHAEDEIDFSELMSNTFPNGMCAIGVVYDEINFSEQVAYVRIERQTYTTENRILAEQSGRAFVYDQDYIYIVKETPDRVRFNISSQVTVYDHGVEYFTGTTIPVLTYQLFGQNLKDKLRREVVAVTPQNFSVAQKAIARSNIDAAYDGEVIKTINHKVPDAYGDITIVEGTGDSSYGMYRVNAVIPVAAWQANSGAYQVIYSDPLISSTMDGIETWLDDPEVMLGKTRFTTIDGGLVISTAVLPTETWNLHVSLAANGSQVLEDVYNKTEENAVALVEHGNTAFHSITAGQYVLWKGALYKATTDIAANTLFVASGNGANLSAISDGVANELQSFINTLSSNVGPHDLGSNTVANIETAIVTLGSGMSNGESRNILFAIATASGEFAATAYSGFINKISTARYVVFVQQAMHDNVAIIGNYKDTAWSWTKIAPRLDKATQLSATNVTNDTYVRQLPIGVYQLSGTKSSYLPVRYGTLFISRSGNSYGFAMIVATESGSIYIRHFTSNEWHTDSWIEIARKNILVTEQIYSGEPSDDTGATTYNLTKAYNNYMFIGIHAKTNTEHQWMFVPTGTIGTANSFQFFGMASSTTGKITQNSWNYQAACSIKFPTTTTFKHTATYNNENWRYKVVEIVGIFIK